MSAGAPSASKLVGTTFAGKYRIVQLLRSGGVADVYLAEMLTLRPAPVGSREVRVGRAARLALKILREPLQHDRAVVRRFERGAAAASRIVHPNVVQTAPLERLADGLPFFAMELLIGLDLADTLAFSGPLDAPRAVRIAAAVAAGLSAAHAAGVVHLDVKPENVFLVHAADGRELVKLLDFGLASLPDDDASIAPRVDAACSTPGYMAPEQTRGVRPTPAMDVYALGVMLREMVTGGAPGPAAPPRAKPSPRLAAALDRALASEPADRFATMDEFRAALLASGEDERRAPPAHAPGR